MWGGAILFLGVGLTGRGLSSNFQNDYLIDISWWNSPKVNNLKILLASVLHLSYKSSIYPCFICASKNKNGNHSSSTEFCICLYVQTFFKIKLRCCVKCELNRMQQFANHVNTYIFSLMSIHYCFLALSFVGNDYSRFSKAYLINIIMYYR